MNRVQLQQLAEERVRDAEALLQAGQWSGAYYLAGYAVECGLKACIAKKTNEHDYPDKDLAQRCYTHKCEALVEIAGLLVQHKADVTANPALGAKAASRNDFQARRRRRNPARSASEGFFAPRLRFGLGSHADTSWE